jgi:FkbM family methyltransferase
MRDPVDGEIVSAAEHGEPAARITQAEAERDATLAVSPSGFWFARPADARLELNRRDPGSFIVTNSWHEFSGNLSKGIVLQAMRAPGGRPGPTICHSGNVFSFRQIGRYRARDVEDHIVDCGIERLPGQVVLFHESRFAAKDLFGPERPFARLRYEYTIQAKSPVLLVTVTLTAEPGATVRDPLLTTGLDALSRAGGDHGMRRALIAQGGHEVVVAARVGMRSVPVHRGPADRVALPEGAGPTDVATQVRLLDGAALTDIRATSGGGDALHWLLLRYRGPTLRDGAAMVVREERLRWPGGTIEARDTAPGSAGVLASQRRFGPQREIDELKVATRDIREALADDRRVIDRLVRAEQEIREALADDRRVIEDLWRAHEFRRSAGNAAEPRQLQSPVYLGDRVMAFTHRGQRIFVPTNDLDIAPHLFTHGMWEPHVEAAIEKLAPLGGLAIDIGANLGYHTLALAEAVGASGKVHAFEASPALAPFLRSTLFVNGLTDRVAIHAMAVSDTNGTLELAVQPNHFGSGNVVPPSLEQDAGYRASYSERFEVPSTTLDAHFAGDERPCNILRLDIEGSEPQAIRGGSRLLANSPELRIICEWSVGMMSTRGDVGDFVHWLGNQGFRFWVIGLPGALFQEVSAIETLNLPHSDLLIMRQPPPS